MAANMGSQQPLQQPQLQQIQQQQQIQQPQSQLPQQSQLQSQSQTQPQSQQQVSASQQTQQQTPPQQQQQQQLQQLQLQQQQKRLVVAVEGTAALGPSWALLKSEYVEKIVRAFCAADPTGQRPVATGEMSLVVFYSHGHSDCLLQRSGWTSNLDTFLQWLSTIEFVGGGFGEVAIAEGLTQVLMMCGPSLSTQSSIQGMERNHHCLLIAASDPHKLPTPIPNLLAGSTQQIGVPSGWCLADAEAVATSFSQNCVSLSVLSPRQLPSLKALFNGARRNGGAIETGADVLRHPQHLVLLSELFPEAKATLARNIVQHPVSQAAIVKLEQPPTQVVASSAAQSNSKATSGWQGMPPNGNLPMQNVKAEINQAPPISSAAAPSASLLGNAVPLSVQTAAVPIAGQEVTSMSTENTSSQDYKLLQPLRSVGNSITSTNILTNAQGNPGMRQTINSSNLAGGAPLGIQTTTSSQPSLHGNLLSASNPMAIAKNALGLTQQGIGMPMSTNSMGLSGAAMGQGAGAVSIGQGGLAASMGQLPMDNGLTGLVSGTTSLVTTTNLGAVSQQANGLAGLQNVGGLGQPITAMGQGISHVTHTATGVPSGLGAVHGGLAGVSSNSGTMIPTPGLAQQVPSQSGATPLHMPSAVTPPQQPVGQSAGRYTKLWEGILAGQRQGRPVHICKLEGYRQTSSPDNLAADWPSTMQIVRLIAQDYMSSKEYQGKAELLVFRPTSQHGFLSQLAEKKLCAVIQLPSQTLLLASAINGDKPNRMIGMLFPGDMVVFKPQAASQAAVPTSAQGLAATQTFVPQGQLAVQPVPGQLRPMMPNTPPLPSGAFLP